MSIQTHTENLHEGITPKTLYFNRRQLLAGLPAALLVARELLSPSRARAAVGLGRLAKSQLSTSEKASAFKDVTIYNNFYDFGTSKEQPAQLARNFTTSPWVVSVEGEAGKPRKFTMEEILKVAPLEERISRHQCVEGWSIVVPWVGYSLSMLLRQVEPTSKARFVAFESDYDPRQMPEGKSAGIPLTLPCVGMYGEALPPQDDAPVRLIVPWKYGFKSISSLVKIKLVSSQSQNTGNLSNSHEYGFYSNVNPQVDHPRWSQASERRLGELRRRPTAMFNSYAELVAQLYAGMDLRKNY